MMERTVELMLWLALDAHPTMPWPPTTTWVTTIPIMLGSFLLGAHYGLVTED